VRVLVTGGAGFIGSHIVEHFHAQAEVRVLDNLRSGFKRNIAGFRHEFIQGSILDRDQLRQAMTGVDYVFHLAAMISVPESMDKPIECNEINTIGTITVLEEAARAKVKKLVLSTSAAIYGDNPIMPKVETMFPEPKSPYAITDRGQLATACLRYFNVFGPRQDPKSQYAAAVPIFIDHAVKHAPITIFGDGEQTRDFIFVKDVVAANVFFATQSSVTGVLNVAYGQRLTINDLAKTIVQLTGSRSELRYAPARAGDIKHSLASTQKSQAAGFRPVGNLAAALQQTIAGI